MTAVWPWHVAPLRELLSRRNAFPHALLIHGRRGIGKLEFARVLAKSLLCETPLDGVACDACVSCHWFREGNHPDIRELQPEAQLEDGEVDAASTEGDAKKKSKDIRIEQVRAVSDFMTLTTHRAGFRVLLIHPAETMNAAAANALLKTLEEPPPSTAILLVSNQVARLPATIRSRCQRVRIAEPAKTVALGWLAEQGVTNNELALSMLAMTGGAPVDALETASPERQASRSALVRVLSEPDLDHIAAAQALEKNELSDILGWMQTWVFDLVLSRLVGEVRFFLDHPKPLNRIAERVELPRLFRLESELRQARRTVNHPLNARLLLEQLLISYKLATKPMS